MSCTDSGPFDGGTYNAPTIIDGRIVEPEITGGSASQIELKSPSITGEVDLGKKAAKSIAEQLCEHIAGCVSFAGDEVAKVFNDCNGLPHKPGDALPSCDDMEKAITDALDGVFDSPSIKGAITLDLEARDSLVKQLAGEVLAKLRDCAGIPLEGGDQVPTCGQMRDELDKVRAEADAALKAAVAPVVSSNRPYTSGGVDLPTVIVGESREQVLGRPSVYLRMGNYLVPAYVAKA